LFSSNVVTLFGAVVTSSQLVTLTYNICSLSLLVEHCAISSRRPPRGRGLRPVFSRLASAGKAETLLSGAGFAVFVLALPFRASGGGERAAAYLASRLCHVTVGCARGAAMAAGRDESDG
jgi:hypothetical protein